MEYYYEESPHFNYSAHQPQMQPEYTYPRTRPGRLPAIRDEELDHVELERRQRRRERNRHAAARCRMRRTQRVGYLHDQVEELQESNRALMQANKKLQAELERVTFQMGLGQANICKTEQSAGNGQNITVSFTPLLGNLTFEFPAMSEFTLGEARKESVTEFNKLSQRL